MSGVKWNEEGLSESPLVEGLQQLGYSYVDSGLLDAERGSLGEVILTLRLARALRKRNPWLSESNLKKAIRALTHPHASSLQEANQALYTALTYGVEVLQDLGSGTKTQQVHFFDFLNPASNEWVVTRQLRVAGSKIAIIPDVVLYVNGIPLVVIECKSPGLGEQWQQQAIDQLTRYQELAEKYRDRGAPKLFQTVQLCIVTCLQDALYGTVGTPARCYLRWNEPWPHSPAAIEAALGRPATPQDVLMYGMLTPENLLDLIHNFVVFESNPQTGKTEKKVPRYQQFSAVNKAVARARGSSQPAERGGVVWHTQGSGKSLTMLWLAMKLRRDPRNDNPTLLIVTDRKDLDEQISRNFKNCGYPDPIHASSVRELRALLKGPTGKTIMTTVQKFQEAGGVVGASGKLLKPKHPELSPAENLFVLTDEAHRTQYGSLAANLRHALPNAVFFGFTGTPIDKKDRSTLHTFGSYIDQYTIEQAVKDGATVPIFYESRLPELRVIGQTLDKVFDHVFADRSAEERAAENELPKIDKPAQLAEALGLRDRPRHERRQVRLQLGALIRELVQPIGIGRHGIARRVVAADDQQAERPDEFRQRHVLRRLAMGHHRDQVELGRLGSAHLPQRRHDLGHLHQFRGALGFAAHDGVLVLDIGDGDVGPMGELAPVFLGKVEQRRQHHGRKLGRHEIDPVEGLVARQALQDIDHALPDEPFELGEADEDGSIGATGRSQADDPAADDYQMVGHFRQFQRAC